MACLGPLRAGVRYLAYTDWELSWSYLPTLRHEGWVAADVDVLARVVITLPAWLAPPSAPAALRATCDARLARLRDHEEQHAAHARDAAQSLHDALAALTPRADLGTLARATNAVAAEIIEGARDRDRRFDGACRDTLA
jgi:predicted secreted Zn-dependent protease